MNKPVRVILLLVCGAVMAVHLVSCSGPPPVTCVKAPPGPAELGPATGLSAPPAEAVVFDLKYVPQTGAADDIQYHSYWGYGGSMEETKTNSFLQDVRKKASVSGLYYVQNTSFKAREWAAVEYHGRQATAFYFDLNGDGKLDENERIPPTRTSGRGVEFITPDFTNAVQDGEGQRFSRVLLQVNFWDGSSEPNCMWSPAALMKGTANLNGKSTPLLLYVSNPGGRFDQYGSSSYSLLPGDQARLEPDMYVPRETLSTLIPSEGKFYHLTIEGRRSNGLPARAVLVKDTTPTGSLAVKLTTANSVKALLTGLYLHGVDDSSVYFRVGATKDKVILPAGTYSMQNGTVAYGGTDGNDWEVSFTEGPHATIKENEVSEVALGQPTLMVRAIEERERYNRSAAGATTFKQGTSIYLEPKIAGKGQEVFSRFRQPGLRNGQKPERPPKVTITGSDGKQLLAATMEYG